MIIVTFLSYLHRMNSLYPRSNQMATFGSAGFLIWLWGWGDGQGGRAPMSGFLYTVRGYLFCTTRNLLPRSPGLEQRVQLSLSGGREASPGNSAMYLWSEPCLLATPRRATQRLGIQGVWPPWRKWVEEVVTRVNWANLLGLPHCPGETQEVEECYSFPAVVLGNLHELSGSWLFIWKNRAKHCTRLGECWMIECLYYGLTRCLAHKQQFLNIATRFSNIPRQNSSLT